ncbi:MAG TPA: sigma 54 modulation/S30EA ribosomal C-terminal domain-containing protein [Terriglobia bacterium]|nr:sigma 54 modulation/S30EA ribosomal C-terminal domain-containing protein [Terriglobia bacterium]
MWHLHHAEATINYYGHQLVGLGSNADLFTAIAGAAEKLEKQAVKARTKWRDTKRQPRKATSEAESEPVTAPRGARVADSETETEKRVYRVNHHQRRKPMTLEEAMLEMDPGRDYLVYRDAETDRVSVLMRRRDGHFDLVEG